MSTTGVPIKGIIDLNQHQMKRDGEIDPKIEDQDHQISRKEGDQDQNHSTDPRVEDMMTGDRGIDLGANQGQGKCSHVRSLT